MFARARLVIVIGTLVLAAAPGGANPSIPQTLIAHYAPQITFSSEPPEGGWDQAYYSDPVIDPEDLNLRIDVGGQLGVVWYVLAAMSINTEWCGVEFGLGQYDPAAFVPISDGPCFPSGGIEVPGPGWPGPETGTALITTDVPWEGVWVPVYYFVGYAYSEPGPTCIPIACDRLGTIGRYYPCEAPLSASYFFGYSALGINADGTASPPTPQRACCFNEMCSVEDELSCVHGGGVWLAGHFVCEPHNPCDKGACCLAEGCQFVREDSCHVLHPEITGEFPPGELWHATGTCDPGNTWCTPSPIHEKSWGGIKLLYHEPQNMSRHR